MEIAGNETQPTPKSKHTVAESDDPTVIHPYDAVAVHEIVYRQRRRRIWRLIIGGCAVILAVAGALWSLQDSLLYYKTPSQALARGSGVSVGDKFRLGGLVMHDSVRRFDDRVVFDVGDNNKSITVEFGGVVPDLFREGQGVVADGMLVNQQKFIATTLFAKHDENYRPPGVDDEIVDGQSKEAGNAYTPR